MYTVNIAIKIKDLVHDIHINKIMKEDMELVKKYIIFSFESKSP